MGLLVAATGRLSSRAENEIAKILPRLVTALPSPAAVK